MVRKGLFGDLVHAKGAYEHGTRSLKIRDYGDGLWLGDHHVQCGNTGRKNWGIHD